LYNIKLSISGNWPIERQFSNKHSLYEGFNFFINNDVEECDYWFVFNYLNNDLESTYCPPDNIILIAPEPKHVQKYYTCYLKQFNLVVSNQPNLNHKNNLIYQTSAPWFINKNFDELLENNDIKKIKILSIITSNKTFTKEHKKRYNFALAIKKHFKDKVDLFGRGINNFGDKWDVTSPYKYTIAIENGLYNDYFTEKLTDSFLSMTYPLYYGCPNLNKYFSEDSFTRIDVDNLQGSINIIDEIISNTSFYNNHLNSLVKSKNLCLFEYNLFNLIVTTIKSLERTKSSNKRYNTLINKHNNIPTFLEKLHFKTKSIINNF
jgi:hypothetical protein